MMLGTVVCQDCNVDKILVCKSLLLLESEIIFGSMPSKDLNQSDSNLKADHSWCRCDPTHPYRCRRRAKWGFYADVPFTALREGRTTIDRGKLLKAVGIVYFHS